MAGEEGQVIDTNVLRQTVRVLFEENDEKEIREYHVDEIGFRGNGPKASEDGYEGPVAHTTKETEAYEFSFNKDTAEEKKEHAEERHFRDKEGRENRDRRGDRDRGDRDRRDKKGDFKKNRKDRDHKKERPGKNDKNPTPKEQAHDNKPAEGKKKQRPYFGKRRRTQKKG